MIEIIGTNKEIELIEKLIVSGSWNDEELGCVQYEDVDGRKYISDGKTEFEYKLIKVIEIKKKGNK